MRNLAAIFFAVIVLFSLCCQKKNAVAPAVDAKAAAIWSANEKIFESALNGSQENDEFDRACEFFWRLTGLELHLNYSTLGIFPTKETPKDLVRIKDWYKSNKNRLYWDETAGVVKVRPGP